MEQKEQAKVDTPIPEAPTELYEKATTIYEELYQLLIDEGRGKEKYRFTVAIAANSLYFYRKALQLFDTNDNDFSSPQTMNQSISAVNKASGEYFRAAKSLLLTPESEDKVKMIESETEKEDDFFAMISGKTVSGNEKRSVKTEAKPKVREGKSKKHK